MPRTPNGPKRECPERGGDVVSDQAAIEEYNYSVFVGSEEFTAFRTHLPVGSSAPDFEATLLETGQPVRLSEYWKKGDVVIEFGSLT